MMTCINGGCPRASWCKRHTYNMGNKRGEMPRTSYICSEANGWKNYVKNKAREIYERENPNDIF